MDWTCFFEYFLEVSVAVIAILGTIAVVVCGIEWAIKPQRTTLQRIFFVGFLLLFLITMTTVLVYVDKC
jgi:hypothetical protein